MSTLAIHGGSPVLPKKSMPWPLTTPEDEKNLLACYDSGAWGCDGEQNRRFAQDFAAYSHAKHCFPVANGTVSIELVLRALGIGRGDEVIVPPFTFIASISSLIYVGATPVFADLDPDDLLLSPEAAEQAITPRTKAIMPVLVGGRPVDLERYETLCRKHGLYLILDAAQAAGTQYLKKGLGSWGTAASISCQNSKNLTCGEGGILLTSDDALAEKLGRMLHGGTDERGKLCTLSLAAGMSEFQAALLNSQLPSLDAQIEKRMASQRLLNESLKDLPFVKLRKEDPRITKDSLHLYLLGLDQNFLKGVSREVFTKAVRAEGVPLTPGYAPVYDFPCLAREYVQKCLGTRINVSPPTPVAENLARREGCWIYHAELLREEDEIKRFADGIQKVYEHLDDLR